MPEQEVSIIDHHVLTIAGVRFVLSGSIDAKKFALFFQPFWGNGANADLNCEVSHLGPDDALMSELPAHDKPWSFMVRKGLCEVNRRSQDGETRWRIAGPLTFDHVTITWNPNCFTKFYGSYENSWSTGLGLSLLGLRLHAHGGLLLHGNAADVDGQGILCVGVSGRGKSTLARLLEGAGARVLTDERPVLRQWPPPAAGMALSHDFRVYGSPWPSSAGLARNTWAPLRRIYFLEHGETDQLTPLPARDAVRRLVHVMTIPWQDPVLLDPCLATVDMLLRNVPCAVLAFRPTPAVVDLIRKDLCQPEGRRT
jgi:hypothetical protein